MAEVKSDDKVFADGFSFKKPNENAPDFVVGSVSVKVDQAIPFLTTHAKNGWVNLDVKVARSGNPYIELYQPKAKVENPTPVAEPVAESNDDLPF